jgi:hypothetical protein
MLVSDVILYCINLDNTYSCNRIFHFFQPDVVRGRPPLLTWLPSRTACPRTRIRLFKIPLRESERFYDELTSVMAPTVAFRFQSSESTKVGNVAYLA